MFSATICSDITLKAQWVFDGTVLTLFEICMELGLICIEKALSLCNSIVMNITCHPTDLFSAEQKGFVDARKLLTLLEVFS